MNGQYITTTELREQSSKLVLNLMTGEEMTLIHRSKIIGIIKPVKRQSQVIDDLAKFKRTLMLLKPKKIIPYKNRLKLYRKYLRDRYVKGLS